MGLGSDWLTSSECRTESTLDLLVSVYEELLKFRNRRNTASSVCVEFLEFVIEEDGVRLIFRTLLEIVSYYLNRNCENSSILYFL